VGFRTGLQAVAKSPHPCQETIPDHLPRSLDTTLTELRQLPVVHIFKKWLFLSKIDRPCQLRLILLCILYVLFSYPFSLSADGCSGYMAYRNVQFRRGQEDNWTEIVCTRRRESSSVHKCERESVICVYERERVM